MTRAPNALASWRAKIDTPPVPERQDGLARRELPRRRERAPGRDGSAWQRSGLLEGQMRWDCDQGLFAQDLVVREQSVAAGADMLAGREAVGQVLMSDPSRDPLGMKRRGHPVADLEAADAFAHRHDLAGAVTQRNDAQPHRLKIDVLEDHQVAEVERRGPDAHGDLTKARFWIGATPEAPVRRVPWDCR